MAQWTTAVSKVLHIFGFDGTDPQPIRTDSNGRLEIVSASGTSTVVGGPAADDAAASGNPVPVGGDFITLGSLPTYTSGDAVKTKFGSRGALLVQIMNQNGTDGASVSTSGADGLSTSSNALLTKSFTYVFDGTSSENKTRQVINATDSTGTGIAAAGLVAQLDDVSPGTVTENQFGNVRMGADRVLLTHQQGKSFLNIVLAAPTTTVVKSGAGHFHTLTINKPTATGVITIYDNTAASGTVIATITQPAALLSSGPVSLLYDVAFATGLTIVTATAAQDITATYR